ncbi:twin-arginine translocase TatA/TatE family subunit [Afifella sp. IM 167]|uniref:twin-arginine translocase TatA/TatE family subunit n=1 Tax=Afifella sp. IM 167 TaxID=2033586 RepID=UPI001CCEF14D|nr:twin-arginine translocase TatA/TatE family subunit [Afifella sp. IM 167]MBZ8132557.1 twin-arginine translocase TatA/TatE family subunit [Afifella sp. IM 167]
MSVGFWQIMIIAVIVVLLFGRGKISELMGDVAKGIKSFKAGMAEDETPDQHTSKTIEHNEASTVEPAEKKQNVG